MTTSIKSIWGQEPALDAAATTMNRLLINIQLDTFDRMECPLLGYGSIADTLSDKVLPVLQGQESAQILAEVIETLASFKNVHTMSAEDGAEATETVVTGLNKVFDLNPALAERKLSFEDYFNAHNDNRVSVSRGNPAQRIVGYDA